MKPGAPSAGPRSAGCAAPQAARSESPGDGAGTASSARVRRCRTRSAARAIAAALLLAAGGCASLPTIVPDMARSVRATPQLVGAKGPLSAERSRQILARLQADQPGANLLARHLALEQAISDSPLSAGNKVELLEDGPRTYAAMLDAIASARDHIDMETYILEDDEAGRRFADALIERQRAGVQVNLIYDSVGTLSTPAAYFDRLREAGVALVEFNPVNPLLAKTGWDVNQRDHRKLLVVDGSTAILGGINISSVYSGGSSRIGSGSRRAAAPRDKGRADGTDDNDGRPWRDTDLLVRGPVVAELQKLFFQTWEKQKGPPVAPRRYYPALTRQGDEVVHAIAGAPDEPYSLIYATLISAIDNAEREVLLTNAYFVPDPQLLASLKAAAARGVDVRLVLPGHSDAALVFHAGRSYYEELLSAGVKIYERRTALLHAKTALIDGVWSTVGSTNLDWRSFLHNQELNVVVLGPGFAAQMRASFDADLAQSDAIDLSRWRRRSPVLRLKEGFARIWQYWL